MKRLLPIYAVVLAAILVLSLTGVPMRPSEPSEAESLDGPAVSEPESTEDETSAEPSEEPSAESSDEEPSEEPSAASSDVVPLISDDSNEPLPDDPSEEPAPDDNSKDDKKDDKKDDDKKEDKSSDTGKTTNPDKYLHPDDPDEPAPERDGMPATLLISEVMPKNKLYPIDGVICDWVELYNNTGSAVTLSSYYLTDTPYELNKYRLPSVKLQAGGYIVLRFGPEIDFSISADGDESLILTNGSKKIHTLKIPKTKKNISILQDGSQTSIPTPGRANASPLDYTPGRELLISEVIPLNSKIAADDGNCYGIIEIQNASSTESVSLAGYALSVSAAELGKYPLPDVTLAPGGFAVFYAVPEETAVDNPMYLPIPLASGNRTLFLTNAEGKLTDTLYVPQQVYNGSYGRYAGKSVYFLYSSVGKENTVGYELPSMPVEASVKSGFYTGSVRVTLSVPDKGNIYYTTDGSEPTSKSTKYDGEELLISRTTSVRAISIRHGQTPSPGSTYVYMIDLPDYTADVMQLSLNPSDFKWIYTNYTSHKEVHANATFFVDGKEEFTIDCGLKINGKSSRKLGKKSFQLKFRIEYGSSALKYQMFEKLDISEFKALVLRSGSAGAAAFRYFINDEFATSVVTDAETTVLAQSYRPVNLYVNGEYYGIYFIREKVNEDFVAAHLGVSSDSVDIVKGMKTLEYGYSKGNWDEIWTYAQKHSMTTDEEYEWMDERICLQEVMDFYIIQSWCCNTDAGNIRVYRSRELDGKWHWLLFDLDQTFAAFTKQYGSGTVESMLAACETTNSAGCRDYNCIFYKMFQNSRFRDEFYERLQWWAENDLSAEAVSARCDRMMDEIEHDMQYSIPRWANLNDGVMSYHKSMEAWLGKIETLRKYWLSQERLDNFLREYEEYIEKFEKKWGKD